ncbi:sensor histidine kinase [Streptosporangium sp. NPDC001559]|uniref:sensor histidine kinase n=1 Tax=Streptosporangium sp. NPDC001559 TaxID=3366187 RepID=UPI0036E9A2C9
MWRVDLPAWRVALGLLVLAVVCLSLAAARLARERRLLLLSLAAERTRLAGQREALSRAAAMRERARIAGELHDVVAHGVSMMTLGVGAGRMIMEKDPARARETLRVAEESGRQALVELQRILSLLSVEGAPAATRHPQPRLSDLSDLLTQVRTAGLRVQVVEDGSPVEVGLTLELAAYRIVQEALGNTLKHAGASTAHVTLRWRPGFLDVLVRDDGQMVPPPAGTGAGTGLLGMRERATMFGGTLEARPMPEGGFEVRARLPTTGELRPGARLPT